MATEPYLLYTVGIIALGTFQFGYNMVWPLTLSAALL
jgi:hypothetical protein